MVKQGCLLMLTLVWYPIIGCNREVRLSARAGPCVIPDFGYNGEARLSDHADHCEIPDLWL